MKNTFVALLLLMSCNLWAQQIYSIQSLNEERYPKSYKSIFIDTTGSLTKWQINDGLFKEQGENTIETNPNTNYAYWYRIKISNNSPNTNWLLEFYDPHISGIELYENDEIIANSTGSTKKFSTKDYQHKNFVFELNPKKNKVTTYYIRLKSTYHSDFSFIIKTHKSFSNYALYEYFYLGMFYGILAILAIYNLFLYFSIKENSYLYYVAYIACAAIHTFSEDGLGFQFVWPNFPSLNIFVDSFGFPLLLITFLLYSNSFIELKKHEPKTRQWIIISTGLYLISFVYFHFVGKWHVSIFFLYMIPYAITYYASIKIYKKGIKQARFFIIGFAIILVSFLVFFLRVFLNLQGNAFIVYIFNFGFILEAIMLSYALGDKIKLTKEKSEKAQKNVIEELEKNEKLKDKVNRELEQKVRERTVELYDKTQELTDANNELGELRDKLYNMNSELDKSNWRLQKEIKEVTRSKILSKTVTYEDFIKIFPDNLTCLKHLETLKWDNGFKCIKCGHRNYSNTQKPFLRKCSSCKHPESVTANTLFHAVKFPLNKAFYIAYTTCDNQKKITVDELSELLDLRRNTAWGFKKKVETRIQEKESKGNYRLGESWEKIIF